MEFKGKRVLVAGLARSGIAAARLLSEHGAQLCLYDQKGEEAHAQTREALEGVAAQWRLACPPEEALEDMELVVLSPGIPLNAPLVKEAARLGIPVIGELELGYRLSRGTVVAITGTNGKTTTTELTGAMLRNAGRLAYVVGNIGVPFTSIAALTKPDDVIVLEVSSFQLETIRTFHPTVSAMLNIAEDHLNRHGTMEAYIAAKARVFENMSKGDALVLNYDDPELVKLAGRTAARVVWFSRKSAPPEGVYIVDENIVFGGPDGVRTLGAVADLTLRGAHNLENALAASAIAVMLGVPAPVIRHTLRSFEGVEHRIERVRTVNGVTYINDSKGTNVDSTLSAIETMDRPTVIMLGGSFKDMDYTPLAAALLAGGIKHAVLLGQTRGEIKAALDTAGFDAYSVCGGSFEEAFDMARSHAREGDCVLLSPACASFDMFADFEERGARFKTLVNALAAAPGDAGDAQ